jgi:hypothetical protein
MHQFSLDNRYKIPSVNRVFRENILLTLAYMRGKVVESGHIDWSSVEKPFHYEQHLDPDQVMAFHNSILPQYRNDSFALTSAHFNGQEGFLSDGYMMGDGVCHLASLIGWVAKDARLAVDAPTNHDFAVIPEVPRTEGVSIYSQPGDTDSAMQNLYIQNNTGREVTFAFDFNGKDLKISAYELI